MQNLSYENELKARSGTHFQMNGFARRQKATRNGLLNGCDNELPEKSRQLAQTSREKDKKLRTFDNTRKM